MTPDRHLRPLNAIKRDATDSLHYNAKMSHVPVRLSIKISRKSPRLQFSLYAYNGDKLVRKYGWLDESRISPISRMLVKNVL